MDVQEKHSLSFSESIIRTMIRIYLKKIKIISYVSDLDKDFLRTKEE